MALYAFDGTWNDSTAPDTERDINLDTNVHRFRELYDGKYKTYLDGVGSRGGLLGKLLGGAIGAGAQQRIEEMFMALQKNFVAGDNIIDIVGYSRGAAIARMFVHRIEFGFEQIQEVNSKWLTQPPSIRFLGLFDTVASFGIPWTENEGDFRPDIPEFVENTYHAMALDETRETFGIERCLGNRTKITEVWFRGGHGDIGGNATYLGRDGAHSNRQRSDIALDWMVAKGIACGLPVKERIAEKNSAPTNVEAPVTAIIERISIGKVGTLSRRIHLGDLVHHSVERTELTRGITGRMLRRIDVPTRIEDEELQKKREVSFWIPPVGAEVREFNSPIVPSNPSLVELSSRRYPFDVLPARTWAAWLSRWELENPGIDDERLEEFWSPTDADRGLAWDTYVELQTRITTQELREDEGNDYSALESVYKLFPNSREYMHKHGVRCANAAALLTAYLNQKVRRFTAKWHQPSWDENWEEANGKSHAEFRQDLKEIQPILRKLATALSDLADARL
jgi:Uncharacterized alpha/beta hydrolase domain (DUF2235)